MLRYHSYFILQLPASSLLTIRDLLPYQSCEQCNSDERLCLVNKKGSFCVTCHKPVANIRRWLKQKEWSPKCNIQTIMASYSSCCFISVSVINVTDTCQPIAECSMSIGVEGNGKIACACRSEIRRGKITTSGTTSLETRIPETGDHKSTN